jgi:hypothetical protein
MRIGKQQHVWPTLPKGNAEECICIVKLVFSSVPPPSAAVLLPDHCQGEKPEE